MVHDPTLRVRRNHIIDPSEPPMRPSAADTMVISQLRLELAIVRKYPQNCLHFPIYEAERKLGKMIDQLVLSAFAIVYGVLVQMCLNLLNV